MHTRAFRSCLFLFLFLPLKKKKKTRQFPPFSRPSLYDTSLLPPPTPYPLPSTLPWRLRRIHANHACKKKMQCHFSFIFIFFLFFFLFVGFFRSFVRCSSFTHPLSSLFPPPSSESSEARMGALPAPCRVSFQFVCSCPVGRCFCLIGSLFFFSILAPSLGCSTFFYSGPSSKSSTDPSTPSSVPYARRDPSPGALSSQDGRARTKKKGGETDRAQLPVSLLRMVLFWAGFWPSKMWSRLFQTWPGSWLASMPFQMPVFL